MKKILKKIKKLLDNRHYSVVYQTQDGRTEMYTISKPEHSHEFGNQKEGIRTAGFRAFCHNRGDIRSFRYDRIVALNRA
tara:strand:+ start:294 stop:530 length:237 start_codon:yes stop_codon:yes gene_type:complete